MIHGQKWVRQGGNIVTIVTTKKIVTLLILITALTVPGLTRKAATLTELLNPTTITVGEKFIYITQKAEIFIYRLKDYSFVKKFGKSGEGPREFVGRALVFTRDNDIVVSSRSKVSIFSNDGVYKKEFKAPSFGFVFRPFGDKFIGYGFARDEKKKGNVITINILTAQLEKEKEVYRHKTGFQRTGSFDPLRIRNSVFYGTEDKIILDGKDGKIHIFDRVGKPLKVIDPKIEPIKFTSELATRYRNFYKTTTPYRRFYEQLKRRIKFPSYFPTIQFLFVADNTIYILTYKHKGESYQFILYDVNGKRLKEVMAPYLLSTLINPYPPTIQHGKLYQLVENEEDEEWDLHITGIK